MFVTNDEVRARYAVNGERIGGYGGEYLTIAAGSTGTVTRANTLSSLVRFRRPNGTRVSIWVDNNLLEYDASSGKTPGRKLGTKPEGDEYLDPNDPRLEWFWDDVSAYAAKSQYCNVFDNILRDLGLPARKQSFTARGQLNGLDVSATVLARTQTEANQIMEQRLRDAIKQAASELEDEGVQA